MDDLFTRKRSPSIKSSHPPTIALDDPKELPAVHARHREVEKNTVRLGATYQITGVADRREFRGADLKETIAIAFVANSHGPDRNVFFSSRCHL
jgi:hypothetical protein